MGQVGGWFDGHAAAVWGIAALDFAGGGDGCFVGLVCPDVGVLGGCAAVRQHQLVILRIDRNREALVALELFRVGFGQVFAAGGNGDRHLCCRLGLRGHADAFRVALQTIIANGDGFPICTRIIQIHIVGGTAIILIPHDGR